VRVAIAVGVAFVALVALGQWLGPVIAARVVRGKIERYGTVRSVTVRAWPAVKLLWRHADEVRVRAGALKLSPEEAAGLLGEAKGTQTVLASAQSAEVGGLRLRNAWLEKHGGVLRAEGTVSEADIRRALPSGVAIELVRSEGGTITVRASGGLFGVGTSVEAIAEAEDGKLVVHPTAPLLSGLKLRVFASGSVYVEGVHARALGQESGAGGRRYELSMWASLR
jgi:hypothetical protein